MRRQKGQRWNSEVQFTMGEQRTKSQGRDEGNGRTARKPGGASPRGLGRGQFQGRSGPHFQVSEGHKE